MKLVPCPSCKMPIVFRHNTYCGKCKKFWPHKQINEDDVSEYTEKLTFDEKQDYALEALVNWCMNTEEHLSVARKLKEDKRNKPLIDYKGGRRWCKSVIFLMDRMFKELAKAEPDTVERIGGFRPIIDPGTFLDNISDCA